MCVKHRARQLMGGVNWPNSRVHIWQTSTQVVVQRCGLTSDRKTAPRPPAPAHPRQSQYMWTLKMGTPRIRNQEHSITCAAEDARFNELLRAFSGALLHVVETSLGPSPGSGWIGAPELLRLRTNCENKIFRHILVPGNANHDSHSNRKVAPNRVETKT